MLTGESVASAAGAHRVNLIDLEIGTSLCPALHERDAAELASTAATACSISGSRVRRAVPCGSATPD